MAKELILIVEDDENIVRSIEMTLSMVGYRTRALLTGEGAAAAIEEAALSEETRPDLILLDVMLPGEDGFEIMGKIEHLGIPVIFLTAMQEVTDKVRGLKLGAEDYIVKPFEALELLARIEVVLRRGGKTRHEQLRLRDITVDTGRHTVFRAGKPVKLTPKEYDLLLFFLQNPDLAISRERLLSAIWGYEFEGESRTVDIHIQQLRKKLGLHHVLVTIPKLGYRLEPGSES